MIGTRPSAPILFAAALVACGSAAASLPSEPQPPAVASSPIVELGTAAPVGSAVAVPAFVALEALPRASAAPSASAPPPRFACTLDSPRKSDDPCTTDSDCDVSDPCHAKACVAKAKANPPGPKTMCTRNLVCDSADVNRCGCFEGRCALIPR